MLQDFKQTINNTSEDRVRVLGNETWEESLSQCYIDELQPWQLLH